MNNDLSDYSSASNFFKTIAYAPIMSAEDELANKILDIARAGINIGNDKASWDLHPFFSILVSSGWNKNTDVFDNVEVWRARHSPKNKAVNIMHSQGDIIGHIIDNLVVDENLKVVADDTPEEFLPSKLHLITASVIYKVWELPKKQSEINKLIASIIEGKTFVSMECLFKSFDFALINKTSGDQRLLLRNDETSFLTKKLRQYGGEGYYQNFTLGRLLRDITFSAQGLVDNPANPESIISSDLNIFNSNFQTLGYINLDQLNGELIMPELKESVAELRTFDITTYPEYKSLVSKLETATAKLAEVDKAHVDGLSKALAAKDEEIEDLKKKKADAEKDVEDKEKEKDEMVKCSQKLKDELETTKAELDAEKKTREAYEAASRKTNRTEAIKLADPALTKEQAVATVEKFMDLSDTTFNAMIETLKGYATRAPKSITAEKVLANVTVEDSPPLGVSTEDRVKAFVSQVKDCFGKKGE